MFFSLFYLIFIVEIRQFGLQNYIINSKYANFSLKIMNYASLIMNYFVPLHPQNDILHIIIAYFYD